MTLEQYLFLLKGTAMMLCLHAQLALLKQRLDASDPVHAMALQLAKSESRRALVNIQCEMHKCFSGGEID